MSKVKTRGGKVVTKIVDAEGKKTKTVENLRRKKKLEKKLKDLDPTNMAVEGTKLGKKKAKLEKKIAKTTKEKRPTTRRAAGETVQGKRHSQTVADARKRLTKQFEEKTQKPIKEFNKKELDAYNKELAELKKQDYKVVDREEGKGITMRSPMKADDDGTTVKTTKLVKKGKTTTETTPGETKTTPSGSAEFNKAYAKACASGAKTFMFKGREILCKQAPEKKETKPTTKTTTTPDKEETLTLKQKKVPTLEFGEGKFNTLKVTDKKKSPRGKKRGKNRKKISLKNLFRRDSKGNKIACGANFAE